MANVGKTSRLLRLSISRYSDGSVTALEKDLPTEQERYSLLLSAFVLRYLKFCVGPKEGYFRGL